MLRLKYLSSQTYVKSEDTTFFSRFNHLVVNCPAREKDPVGMDAHGHVFPRQIDG